jgi:hypothetical protein
LRIIGLQCTDVDGRTGTGTSSSEVAGSSCKMASPGASALIRITEVARPKGTDPILVPKGRAGSFTGFVALPWGVSSWTSSRAAFAFQACGEGTVDCVDDAVVDEREQES